MMGEERKRNEGGRFESTFSDEEIIAVIREHEPASTREVADELDISRQGADYRLRQLRDMGLISSKKVGGSLAWFGTVKK